MKGVKNKVSGVIREIISTPKNIPGTVKEDMTQPSMVWNGEGELLLV